MGFVVPDPVRVSIVGVLAASLMKEMFPDATPLVRGVKVSVNDVLWPGAIVVGKDIPPRQNSELVEVADEIVTLDVVAVSVAVRALLVPPSRRRSSGQLDRKSTGPRRCRCQKEGWRGSDSRRSKPQRFLRSPLPRRLD